MQLFGYYPFEQMRKVFQGEFGVSKLPSGGLEIRFFSMVITISSSGLKFKLGADEVNLDTGAVKILHVKGSPLEVKVSDIIKCDHFLSLAGSQGGIYGSTSSIRLVNDTPNEVLTHTRVSTTAPSSLAAGQGAIYSISATNTTRIISYDATNNLILY